MANFKTHLTVATIGSGLVSTALLGAGIVSPIEVVALWGAGTLGGILPDIDADHSTAVKSIFTALAVVLGVSALFGLADSYSILELWMAFALTYCLVRYPVLKIFYRFTVHRGIFHSIVAAVFFGFLTASLSFHFFDLEAQLSWILGTFISLGYIIHLSLDETYSVDLADNELKSSFGTALELFDYSNLKTSALMISAMVVVFFITPDIESLTSWLFAASTYQDMASSLLPNWHWLP
ncbi:MAG: metal-dependent hydrolase [Chloroflexota bacterium]|nr:metal-dependent hydrolase [Chloroflexota bacterium]